MSDKIKPKYYKVIGDYDVLDIIKALSEKSTLDGFTDHCRFHALKYLFRAGLKDDALQDLKKAAEFLAIGVKNLEEKSSQVPAECFFDPEMYEDTKRKNESFGAGGGGSGTITIKNAEVPDYNLQVIHTDDNMNWRP